MGEIYLDNAATTKLAPEVFEVMIPYFMDNFHNGATKYSGGKNNALAVENARKQVANLINCEPEEIYFTSGGTESNNWAIKGLSNSVNHYITSSIEHHAILNTMAYMGSNGSLIDIVGVDEFGVVNTDDIISKVTDKSTLVSLMYANNEVGVMQNLSKLGSIFQGMDNVCFHTDAVQAVGKLKVDVKELKVDLLSMSAHKFHGPKGIGALYIRKGVKLNKFMHGGSQESGLRAGTSNIAGIVGIGKAAEIASLSLGETYDRHSSMKLRFIGQIEEQISDVKLNGRYDVRKAVPNVVNMSFKGVDCSQLLIELDKREISIACGSACNSDEVVASHVLKAMGLSTKEAYSSVRFSFGRYTTDEEIDKLLSILPEVIEKIRSDVYSF